MTTTIQIIDGLPFTVVTLTQADSSITLQRVLVDSGSAASVFNTDQLATINLLPTPSDPIQAMRGIGGREFVIEKQIDRVRVGSLVWQNATIQMGSVDYGRRMDGIIGLDFLQSVGATLDFKALEMR